MCVKNRWQRAQAKNCRVFTVVAPDDIFDVEANMFVPCALGAQINDRDHCRA
jgi:glutamate dehydrogenase/leucine dehydrogenase